MICCECPAKVSARRCQAYVSISFYFPLANGVKRRRSDYGCLSQKFSVSPSCGSDFSPTSSAQSSALASQNRRSGRLTAALWLCLGERVVVACQCLSPL